MITYEFLHRDCKHEWEMELSITAPDPDTCPACGGKENIVRLISGGSGKGKVELYGQDLVDWVKAEAKREVKEASRDANKYANMLGEDRYHQIQTRMDRRGK
jgi:hypothetical protein